MYKDFSVQTINKSIYHRILDISYPNNCKINLNHLRYLNVKHIDFQGKFKTGELIVHQLVAEETAEIFHYLYQINYPIEKIRLIDEYNGDDELSMSDNNSSAFNYRFIDSTNKLSLHSYGLAIDINPLYNPYVRNGFGERNVLPVNALDYADRNKEFRGKIDEQDLCYKAFLQRGWKWGGHWLESKDYQHFYKELNIY